jgi:hypothetical protein
MVATGIPHHILLAERLRLLEHSIESVLKRKLVDLEEHLEAQLDHLPSKLSASLRSEFNIEGAVALSRNDMEQMMASLRQEIISWRTVQQHEDAAEPPSTPASASAFETFTWGGRLHPVPQGFKFPVTLDVKTLWELWWYGDTSNGIRPYHHIKGFDLQGSSNLTAFCKAKKVLKRIESLARQNGCVHISHLTEISKVDDDRAFSVSYVKLLEYLGRTNNSAEEELSYITIS